MATKPESGKQAANRTEAEVLRESVKREDERKQALKDAQEKDLAQNQQTGGTNDAVTKADVHVEPTRAAAIDPEAQADKVVGGHDATQDKVDYAPKAELEVPASIEDQGLKGLDLYVRQMEDKAALRDNVVVVEISHPDATEGIYEGRDAGIRTRKGAQGVKFSDGSTK